VLLHSKICTQKNINVNNLVKKKGRRLESEAIGAIIRPKVHAFLIPIEVQVPDRKIKMKRY